MVLGVVRQSFHQENPLLLVRLSDKPSEEALEAIKLLGETDPATQDKIFKAWALEIRKLTKVNETPTIESNKNEFKKKLENLRPIIVELLSLVTKKSLKSKKEETETMHYENVSITALAEGPFIFATVVFSDVSHSPEVKWEWVKYKNSIMNMHRKVDTSLRGKNIGGFMENISEDFANELSLPEIYFGSNDTNAGAIFPLTQGYVCETKSDRQKILTLLPDMFAKPEKHNVDREKDLIYFVKKLNRG